MTPPATPVPETRFRHEAMFYAGEEEFLVATVPFLRDAVDRAEPTLVVVDEAKIDALRAALGGHTEGVRFADMADVGANPARIIPLWVEFVDDHAGRGRRLRGIGEPVWPGRTPAELVECQRHESLLNLAFVDAPEWWLLCPYDTAALPPDVLEEARRSHPFVRRGGRGWASPICRSLEEVGRPFDAPLPDPPGEPPEFAFGAGTSLRTLRDVVAGRAPARIDEGRTADLVLAVNEVVTNSLRHGGGRGVLRIWRQGDSVVCEVRDEGTIDHPLAGRQRPDPNAGGGRGLWLANQLCDLVQVRSFPEGSVVRLHMRSGPGSS